MWHYADPIAEGAVEFFRLAEGMVEVAAIPEAADYIVAAGLQVCHGVGRHRIDEELTGRAICSALTAGDCGQKSQYGKNYLFHSAEESGYRTLYRTKLEKICHVSKNIHFKNYNTPVTMYNRIDLKLL